MTDCGSEALMKNQLRAHKLFNDKYDGTTITWEGYIVKIQDFRNMWLRGEHAVVFMVKMEPTENQLSADLILSLEDEYVPANTATLVDLDPGDKISFNATFVNPGNEYRLHHLHAISLEEIPGHMEITPAMLTDH
jgi:hypothetical protein